MLAQVQSTLEFEVASVKPVKDNDCGGQKFRNTPGSLEVLNMDPTTMIRNAYQLVMEGQISGFPAWADHNCFDIEAKADEDPAIELGQRASETCCVFRRFWRADSSSGPIGKAGCYTDTYWLPGRKDRG
jgi:hypothetical protein